MKLMLEINFSRKIMGLLIVARLKHNHFANYYKKRYNMQVQVGTLMALLFFMHQYIFI